MKLGFREFSIHCPFPTTQCGHLSQTKEYTDLHDSLSSRILYLDDGNEKIIHISMDILSITDNIYSQIKDVVESIFGKNISLFISATHTHYGHDTNNQKYIDFLTEIHKNELNRITLHETSSINYSTQTIHCADVGKSRISNYETNLELLTLINFYDDQDIYCSFIVYNVHPTILPASVTYFSSEFIGVTLSQLKKNNPSVHFTYCTGASGDISSRFVRKNQDFNSVTSLGLKLANSIEKLLSASCINLKPLHLQTKFIDLPFKPDLNPIDTCKIRSNLSEREYETLKLGALMREKYKERYNFSTTSLKMSVIELGEFNIIFVSHEIFSYYLNFINLDNNILVSYTNGYGPYILPKNFEYITYEMFMDITDNKFKALLEQKLQQNSYRKEL